MSSSRRNDIGRATARGWLVTLVAGCFLAALVASNYGAAAVAQSGTSLLVGQTQTGGFTQEENVSINDADTIRFFALREASPDLCRAACASEVRCVGYTYVRPGAYRAGDAPMCYLFSAVRRKDPGSCCVSGMRTEGTGGGVLGRWLFRGYDGAWCTVESAGGNRLRLVTERGEVGSGYYESQTTIVVDFPFARGLRGQLSADGTRINWSNREFWSRNATEGTGGQVSVAGTWWAYGSGGSELTRSASITQSGSSLTLDNGLGAKAEGRFEGRDMVVVDGWGVRGTVRDNGNRIDWSNGTYWLRQGATTPTSAYVGCFKDAWDRDLVAETYTITNEMTVDMCVAYCKKKGFAYAGVQYASQCFCGNSYGKYGPASNCNMKCSGNPNQICGGDWANSVYAVK